MIRARWIASMMATCAISAPAYAQTAASVSQSDQTDESQSVSALADIIVTSQRRGENLQAVPITVTAITAESARQQGVVSTGDLVSVTPGLQITPSLGSPQIYLRGVGTQSTAAGDEASNAVYVDGVYMADMPSGLFSLNSIDRIEVLKGPQGTLFGRNSTGGLIHVITRNPSFTPKAELSLGYSSFDTVQAQGYASTALVQDRVAVDLALHYRNQGEGWGTNIATGNDIYKDRDFAARSKLLWDINDTTKLHVALDYSTGRGTTQMARQPIPGTFGVGATPYTGDFYSVNMDVQPTSGTEASGASLRFEHEFSWATFVSLTALRRLSFDFLADQDSSPVNLNNALLEQTTNMVSQEFQLSSPDDSAIKWIGGAFLYAHDLDLTLTRSGTSQTAVGGFSQVFSALDTSSYAFFAQVTVPVGDRLNLTGGARYTSDKRELVSTQYRPTTGAFAPIDTSKTWSKTTWRAAADYKITDDALIYASYSRGFKSGIFATFSPSLTPINPEVLDAIEIGAKTEWLDRRLRMNVSAYSYDYQDIQLTVKQAGASILLNAGAADIKGLDFEILAQPISGLMIRAAANVIDGKYGSFPNAPATLLNPAPLDPPGYVCPVTRPTAVGGTLSCTVDATGNTTIRSPKLTFNVGANYTWRTPLGEMNADVGYYFNDGFFFEVDNRIAQSSYGVFNAQVAVELNDGAYAVRLWGKNLTGEEYYSGVSTSLSDTFSAAAPRTIGIELQARF